MNCKICDDEYAEPKYVNQFDDELCPQCHYRLYGCYGRCGHSLTGVSDGPCSGLNQTHFCKPNPYNETLKAAKVMEEKGQMTPQKKQVFEKMLAQHKNAKYKQVDYQVTGHPLYDRS